MCEVDLNIGQSTTDI